MSFSIDFCCISVTFFFFFFVYVLWGDRVAMEIIIQYSNVDPPRVENCGVCGGTFSVYTTLYNRINLAHINMLFEDKYIRQVIKGCFKSGVQVSEELTFVFVSDRCINYSCCNISSLGGSY